MRMKVIRVFFFCGILSFYGFRSDYYCLSGGKADSIAGTSNEAVLFASHEVLKISIQVPDLKKLLKDIDDNPSYHKGLLTCTNPDGSQHIFHVNLKTRGDFRKDPANCSFPPLTVNFKKSELDNTLFEGQNKLKIVTHCRNRANQYDQNVLKEYLAYRIYNILTEKSYKVRLAEFTYIDESKRKETITRHGFFIEETEDMLKRNRSERILTPNIPQQSLDVFYQDLLSIFQYMIGNTDWSVPAQHNIRLMSESPDQRPVPVPYDFDWSGLVNPVYAKPSEKLGIKCVEDRLFRGFSKDIGHYERIFNLFFEKKEEIYGLIDECQLDTRNCRIVENYLNDFYTIISNEKIATREFVVQGRTARKDYLMR